MRKISDFFKKIGQDKYKHALVGLALFIAQLILIEKLFDWQEIIGATIVLSITTLIAFVWELYQKKTGKGQYDIWDIVATDFVPGLYFLYCLAWYFIR